ncbi:MAG: RNA 2',3'-cyclic phosphodiesterase [Bacteroidota bacterium]|nr:RNA 2',3'-cyclic phosphodiesterase [Bacteroidota bacterium]
MATQQSTHRTFIAIFPPKEILEKLLLIQSQLKNAGGNVRWEKEGKFHFTLQFWGNQPEEWLKDVSTEIQTFCSQLPAFTITITKVGCFPSKRSPRIFWIGSEPNENPNLIELTKHIQTITQHNGLEPDEHPFHPHITLGRAKGNVPSNLIKTLESITFEPLQFRCAEIAVMKSTLTQRGSFYSNIINIPLP